MTMSAYLRYSYNDTPEGQDLIKKLVYTCKYMGLAGFTLGITDYGYMSNAPKFSQKLNLIAAYVLPMVGVTAVFVTANYCITKYRQKDYATNYFMGSVITSIVYGFARKSPASGMNLFTLTLLPILIYKNGHRVGSKLMLPDVLLPSEGAPAPYYLNLFPPKDYPKNYTQGYI